MRHGSQQTRPSANIKTAHAGIHAYTHTHMQQERCALTGRVRGQVGEDTWKLGHILGQV